jgi:glycosyltransferase involved in cell wall biosynthesis
MVGWGYEVNDVKDMVGEMKLDEYVQFLGYIPHKEMPMIYNNCDVLILLSPSEGIANVVLEAMACQTPVIATPVGDIALHLAQGRGWLVESADPKIVAEGLMAMEDDGWFVHERVTAARRYVVENHSYEILGEKYLRFLEEIRGTV